MQTRTKRANIGNLWATNGKAVGIKTKIERIPEFIKKYIENNYSEENINNNKHYIIGKFHLDTIYQNN